MKKAKKNEVKQEENKGEERMGEVLARET